MADPYSGESSGKDASQPAKQSAVVAPQINPPKGGGALRGIDEKFTANAATGTGMLTVQLAISPGRLGFHPQLSLSHNSGSGNGIFGFGWDLSLPSIVRRTDKGLPRYRDREESDIFLISGAEDLVPVLIQEGSGHWIEEPVTSSDACFAVKRYRPRTEGLFARIERWTRIDDGATHWRSISRENVVSVYGGDDNSRVADPHDPHRVFEWLLSCSCDDKGNAMRYEYVAENGAGVDFDLPNEQHRTRSANRYLKRIRYGNRTPVRRREDGRHEINDLPSDDWMFTAVFDYGEWHYVEEEADGEGRILGHASFEPQRSWPVRRDPFSSFRSCFERRTYRLCRRMLMFHHFPAELGVEQCLVHSTAFDYRERPFGSFIERITQSGHKLQPDGRYLAQSLPPLDIAYTASPLEEPEFDGFSIKDVDARSLENLPEGIDGVNFRWLDLDSEGISGVLAEQDETWYYKHNLGNGRLGATEIVKTRPALARLKDSQHRLMDVAGDGNLDLVDLSPTTSGFYERTLDAGWAGFREFASMPVLNWDNANLRFVDLNGDGIADVLITEDDAFTWFPSLLEEGFGDGVRVPVPIDDESGPRVIFADSTQSVHLADMSGHGLSDLVWIQNGQIRYWPNLGYARFGHGITMDNAPRFDDPDCFDQRRIRLSDTDGSGTADILYLGKDGVDIYLNEAGNGWSRARRIPRFPGFDSTVGVEVTDFLGRGTACLLWSSPLPRESGRQLRYLDLMCGQKPHLLARTNNNLGAETHITYASSVEFYLADKAAGKPWVTRLPFATHVVKRVETYDSVSRNRFVSSYTYHHGFYDGLEREFRGFGRVDQLDTEELFGEPTVSDFPAAANFDQRWSVPPVLTKTWFHTGVFLANGRISRHLEKEYFRAAIGGSPHQADESQLNDTILPNGLTPYESREACRALKGAMLRQEIYALDGTSSAHIPYTVAESNFTITPLQPKLNNRYAVFFRHPREYITFNYERNPADPRITHSLTLAVDLYGNVLRSLSIGYQRRRPEFEEQSKTLATLTESHYTNAVLESNSYRTPLPAKVNTYEVTSPALNRAARLTFHEAAELETSAREIGYESQPTPGLTQKRLIQKVRTVYRSNDLSSLLAVGLVESMALPGENYKLAFTPGLLEVFRAKAAPAEVRRVLGAEETGYVDLDGDGPFWIPSGQVFYSLNPDDSAPEELRFARAHFFLPHRYEDPFDNTTTVNYDKGYNLCLAFTRDPAGNETTAETDYRVLQPKLILDPNGNRTEARFDALGMLAGTAVCGKATGPAEGDSFAEFNSDRSPAQIKEYFDTADPRTLAVGLLGTASSCNLYDFSRLPVCAASIARETHVSDLSSGQQTRVQIHFVYSDGFGREAQTRAQAEPGPLDLNDPESPIADPRWVGTGAKIFNNKGKPVRQYEPFFSAAPQFGIEQWGVSSTLFYDPAGRTVATLHPDHTFEKVIFDPWKQVSYDQNDTVTFDPNTDMDIGAFFRRLPAADYLPTWYESRSDGAHGPAQQQAAEKAAKHANTPTTKHFDTLGRPFLVVADNGRGEDGKERKYQTRTVLDIEGNHRAVIDALGRTVERYDYDLQGTRIHQAGMDDGERWTINDVAGKPVRIWTSRDYLLRTDYDELRRPVRSYVRGGQAGGSTSHPEVFDREILFERTIYGDSSESGLTELQQRQANVRAKVFQHFDGGGIVTTSLYDFKGNSLTSTRQFVRDYKRAPDWSETPNLEEEVFASACAYDALNRPTAVTAPDNSIYRPRFNEANLLEKVEVNLRGAKQDGQPAWTEFVSHINYDAKGQRTIIRYGNGAATTYGYDEKTFRLISLKTTREAEPGRLGGRIFKNPATVQDLRYTFDPVGNITRIQDAALETVFNSNQKVDSAGNYTYDPIYRLIEASGREQIGQSAFAFDPADGDYRDYPFVGEAQHNDLNALCNYVESYAYDPIGNFERLAHRARNGDWTRAYIYNEASLLEASVRSNRLSRTSFEDGPAVPVEKYSYDAHGNVTQMPHLPVMQWNFKEQLSTTSRQVVNAAASETTYYVYGGSGQRSRKVTELPGGARKGERIYISGFEVYREFNSDAVLFERQTLHVMDDKQRIALVETKTVDKGKTLELPIPEQRYQFANHLGSACLENLDEAGALITYEEYSPYGNTTYQVGRSASEISLKRYRYTGKERDEENGFCYHGARYYAPWLGRWTACDPAGLVDGTNLFEYVRGSPLRLRDPNGKQADPDGVVRTPGTTSATIVKTAEGTRILANPETSLATDPAFKQVAAEVRAAMTSDSYVSFRATLNQRIKDILAGEADNPLKKILEVREGKLFWKAGTAFAGEELNYAHTIAQQSIKNLGAGEGAAVSLENLEPVGREFHLKTYGHTDELATDFMKAATEEAQVATKAAADEIAAVRVPRNLAGQRGYATVGGMLMALVVVGTAVYVVSQAKDKPEAVKQIATQFAITALIFKAVGGGGVGFAVTGVIGMYSDNAELNRQHAEEEQKDEVAKDFMRKKFPEAVEEHWYGDHFDPQLLSEIKQLLFETKPTVFGAKQ